ncbi:MAG: methionine--tRNA ligase [Deltaproteobacteria bacterium]|nr:methionine--tRNA ligase [Deltaproteobacteria bacterium]
MTSPTPPSTYYVTTPIYYVNGDPHLGRGYTTTLADVLTRYHRLLGRETFFLTGTDEHGEKISQAAEKRGIPPQQFVDEVAETYRKAWETLRIEYSRFIRTTDPQHKAVVAGILQKVYDQGDIYFGDYGGNYCVGCERFLTDKELVDGKCPDHQTVPQYVAEKNYVFRMSKYQDRLIEHITKVAPDFIRPERYKNEVLGLLREPLEDLCISRPKSRMDWGIELPFDSNFVAYVWFDALINYITGLDYPDGKNFSKFWTSCEHLIGKDIVKPHAVFWPTMLMAAGIPLFDHLTVHAYWLTPTGKMSKSLGNVVDPIQVVKEYSHDVFRYYICREMTFGLDGVFSFDTLDTRYNADLANNLGNLVSRSLAMTHKYRNGVVPASAHHEDLESDLQSQAKTTVADYFRYMTSREIHRALESVWALVNAANVYIDRTKPWTLAKTDASDPAAKAALDASLYHQLESLRLVAVLISPFMPDTSASILRFLSYSPENAQKECVVGNTGWGRLQPGVTVEKGEALFPRREKTEKNVNEVSAPTTKPEQSATTAPATVATAPVAATPAATPTADAASAGVISIDEFFKVKLRVGQILAAEKVAKSEKLLKLRVDLGEGGEGRQILSGIAKYYQPEDLVGRKVAVVANLQPAKLMGLESQGMILAAEDATGNLELIAISPLLAPGAEIR